MKHRSISLYQPYASLMACGAKFLETRGWDTHVRGRVHIHAGISRKGIADLKNAPPETIAAMEAALGLTLDEWFTELPYGHILAHGHLIGTRPIMEALEEWPEQLPFGDFTPGRFAHVYQDLTPIEPVRVTGMQKFFNADF